MLFSRIKGVTNIDNTYKKGHGCRYDSVVFSIAFDWQSNSYDSHPVFLRLPF